ncbi:MAG: hypothetical protein QXM96_04255, partial [Candidatus Woesearchaeota archaeon]
SCLSASPKEEESTDTSSTFLDSIQRTKEVVSEEQTITGKRESEQINCDSIEDDNLKKLCKALEIEIQPLCYDDDDCYIKNPHFYYKTKGEEKKPVLEFTIESHNNKAPDKAPDACLMGAARILFKGTGAIEKVYSLCSGDNMGHTDFIDNECKECKNDENSFTGGKWEKTDKCFDEKYCPVSWIGKKINYKGCKECVICNGCTYNEKPAIIGIWQDSQDCEQCGSLEQSEETESENE